MSVKQISTDIDNDTGKRLFRMLLMPRVAVPKDGVIMWLIHYSLNVLHIDLTEVRPNFKVIQQTHIFTCL